MKLTAFKIDNIYIPKNILLRPFLYFLQNLKTILFLDEEKKSAPFILTFTISALKILTQD